jgi:hypothetical protein
MQVLCMNCGICPHKTAGKMEALAVSASS